MVSVDISECCLATIVNIDLNINHPKHFIGSFLSIEDVKEKEDKTKSTDQKRQNTSQKNKLPTYNNKVPLDVSDDNDEQDLYESYDHSLTNTESYTKEMIDDALNGMHETNIADVTVTQAEKQRQMSFESETSNKLRNAQGSFIVSEDAHHEGLAFTERQISFSGLPEVAVQYNANKGAESPLPLEGKQAAYENQAFEIIEENVLIKENNNQLRTTVDIDDTSKLPINKEGSTKTDTERAHNSASGTLLYGDEFVPDTESSEKADSDDLPLYEDAEENHITEPANDKQANDLPLYEDAEESPVKKSTDNTKLDNLPLYEDSAPGIPLYDDNFVPASAGLENGTIEALPVYENAVETKDKLPLSKQMLVANEGSKEIMNPASSGNDVLPIYEYAVDTDNAVPSTRPLLLMNKGSEQPSTALLVNSIPPYNTEIKQKEIINLNDLGDYEDCELSKLPIAPPPPMHGNLNQHTIKNEVGLADRQLPKMDTKEHLDEQLMTEKAITHETYAPPLPLRHDLKKPGITADNNHVLLKESNKSKNVSDAAEFCNNESVSKTVGGPVLSPGLTFEKLKSENITDLQSDHAKSAKLLDLSLAPEMKFRSGSKVDIFDEPGISSSSDAYFLDMNDLPSEIVENSNSDTSPIVDEEKPINISKTNNEVDRGKLLVPLFDNNMLKLEHSGNNETNVTNSYKMNSMNAECDTKDARSNISGNLLQCSNEQFQPVVPQAGSRSSALHNPKVKKNGDCNTLLQFEQVNKEYDDGDLYDIPPPNFPPPELKLN